MPYPKRIERNKINPGLSVYTTAVQLHSEKFNSTKKNKSADTVNRDKLKKMIIKKVKEEGISIDEAIDSVMKEDIAKEFKYLENEAGLDLKTVFLNWVRKDLRNMSRDDDER